MKKARAEADACGDAHRISDNPANRLQLQVVRFTSFHVSKNGEIVARMKPLQVRPQVALNRLVGVARIFEDRSCSFVGEELEGAVVEKRDLFVQHTCLLVRLGELSRRKLA